MHSLSVFVWALIVMVAVNCFFPSSFAIDWSSSFSTIFFGSPYVFVMKNGREPNEYICLLVLYFCLVALLKIVICIILV